MLSLSSPFTRYPLLAGNAVGVVVSVALHGLLLAVLMANWEPSEKPKNVVKPQFIEAKLLQMKPAVAEPVKPKPQAKPKPKPKPKVDQAAKRRAEEQKKKAQAKKAEEKRQQTLKKEQKRTELARQERLKKEAERRRQDELRKQQELLRQQELARTLALEEALLEEEANLQVGTYVGYMANLVASNWSRPPSARRGMEVLLAISLGSGGRVTSVQVSKSSGNPSFDRSAEQAVWRVGQFTRLKEMSPELYQREFRNMFLLFRPDDLRK